MYLGVDEAGKGPVLGPMVSAAVLADPARLPAAVDDSKRLTPARRKTIDDAIRNATAVVIGIATVEPSEIDRPDTDMNTLTVSGQARAVQAALATAVERRDESDLREEPIRVVADAGDTSEARFARRLHEFVTASAESDGSTLPAVDIEAAHGADAEDPVVGAASVVAKVARDARMADIDALYSEYCDVGSGYPSDPATRTFLRKYVADNGDVPDCARRSWATCTDVLAAAAQSELDEF